MMHAQFRAVHRSAREWELLPRCVDLRVSASLVGIRPGLTPLADRLLRQQRVNNHRSTIFASPGEASRSLQVADLQLSGVRGGT